MVVFAFYPTQGHILEYFGSFGRNAEIEIPQNLRFTLNTGSINIIVIIILTTSLPGA